MRVKTRLFRLYIIQTRRKYYVSKLYRIVSLYLRDTAMRASTYRSDCDSPAGWWFSQQYLYTVDVHPTQKKESSKPPTAIIHINSVPVQMIIDSGASTNIIDETAYQQICQQEKIAITKSTIKIMAYGSDKPLPAMGQFRATMESKSHYTVATIHVIKGVMDHY